MGNRVYAGSSARSRREPIVYRCPCGEHFRAEVHRAVDTGDREAVKSLLEGKLNTVRCPSCNASADVQVAVLYHDLEAPRLVLVLPDGLRHRELEERARLYESLAADVQPAPLYVLEADVVFGAAGLRAILAPPPTAEAFRGTTPTPAQVLHAQAGAPQDRDVTHPRAADPELVRRSQRPAARAESHAARPEPHAPRAESRPAPQEAPNTSPQPILPSSTVVHAPLGAEAEHDDESHTRVRMQVPDPRSAMIERWIAGREGPSALLVDDAVLVCAALPPATLECFLAANPGTLELRIQLHRMPSYPVLAVTLVAPQVKSNGDGKRPTPEDHRVLTVPLDIARAAHRVVLEALGRKTALSVELYDSQYLPVVSHTVEAQLEENVRRLVADARDALDRLAPQSRSFERARTMLFQPGYDRLGRTSIELPDDEHESLERPGAVLAALAHVARWSEPSAEAYLTEIRSVPLTRWRTVRARIIRRALDIGIAVSRPLVERSAKDSSPLPSWQELLAIQVRRFAEVSARVQPNDLSAAEEAENWDLLLRECALAGVVVDDQVRQLAAASVKRTRAGTGGGVDLRALGTGELVALLERKELRREAAVILCERKETPTLPALFSVIRRMPRGECNVVLPAVVSFGNAAERWLIEGLKSKKSFMRQGCALALGSLKSPHGVDALVRLLLQEPTEIWGEVARALGDVGAQSVMPLAANLRDVDAERRDRIVHALGHVAARGVRAPIEMLAAGRDTLVAQAAARALALSAEVKAADEKVRRGQSADVQTVVRGFSRRFYEALEGNHSAPIELDPGELEEIEEGEGAELDDHDLLTATDIPSLGRRNSGPDENTSPIPKTSLPGDRQ
jgi:hypothetical protein